MDALAEDISRAFGVAMPKEPNVEDFHALSFEFSQMDTPQFVQTLGQILAYLATCDTLEDAMVLWHPCFVPVIEVLSAGYQREQDPGNNIEKVRLRDLASKFDALGRVQRTCIARWLEWLHDEFPIHNVAEIRNARDWWRHRADAH